MRLLMSIASDEFTYQDTAVAKGTGKSEALATHALTMRFADIDIL